MALLFILIVIFSSGPFPPDPIGRLWRCERDALHHVTRLRDVGCHAATGDQWAGWKGAERT